MHGFNTEWRQFDFHNAACYDQQLNASKQVCHGWMNEWMNAAMMRDHWLWLHWDHDIAYCSQPAICVQQHASHIIVQDTNTSIWQLITKAIFVAVIDPLGHPQLMKVLYWCRAPSLQPITLHLCSGSMAELITHQKSIPWHTKQKSVLKTVPKNKHVFHVNKCSFLTSVPEIRHQYRIHTIIKYQRFNYRPVRPTINVHSTQLIGRFSQMQWKITD